MKKGRPKLDKEKTTRLGIYIQVELWQKFKELAHSQGYNASELLRLLIRDYINQGRKND